MSSSCRHNCRMTRLDGFGPRGSEMMLVSSRYFTVHKRTSRPGVFLALPGKQFVRVKCKLRELALTHEVLIGP